MPHVLAIAITCLVLGVGCFLLFAYLGITGKVSGSFHLSTGKNQVSGTGGGILLAVGVVLMVYATATWPQSVSSTQDPVASVLTPASPSQTSSPPAQVPAATTTLAPIVVTAPPDSAAPATTQASRSRDQQSALAFVNAYLAAMGASDRTEQDLSQWFDFPIDFYQLKGVTDPHQLFELLTPPAPGNRTHYDPPVLLDFYQGSNFDTLVVSVDWTKPDSLQGSSRVTYLLTPYTVGEAYRIRSVSETPN